MNLERIRTVYLRRVVATTLVALGPDVTASLAAWVAGRVFDLETPGRQRAEARLRDAMSPAQSDAATRAIAAEMYSHVARFWTETLFAQRRMRDSAWRRFVRVENESGLRAMAEAGRGCLLTTAAFGNPVVGACALGQIFRPIHVLVDTLAQPQLRAWQRDVYAQRWVEPIDRHQAASVVPAVMRRGGAVLIMGDAERIRGRAVVTDFLGRPLRCHPTLARVAGWFDVPVGVVTCRRNGSAAFSFTLQLHATLRHDPADPDDDGLVRRALAILERAILADPEQYLWSVPTLAAARGRHVPSPLTASASGDRAGIRTGSESARSRTTRRTASASQMPSAVGTRPGSPAAAVEPVPTV